MGEWKTKMIGDLCSDGRGRVISQFELANDGDYPVFSSQTTNNGEMGRLNTYDFDGEFVTWTTDGAGAGTVFYRNGKFNCTNVCGTLKSKSEIDLLFLSYIFGTVAKKYVSYVGNPKLMNAIVKKIPIYYPTDIAEQSHIASVLNVTDETIAASRALVEKYAAIKQGLMRDLTEKLERNATLGSLGEWYGGITPSMNNPHYWGEGYYWLSSGELKGHEITSTSKQITPLALLNTSLRLLPQGTIVMVMRSGILNNYFPVAELKTSTTINQDIKAIVLYEGINSHYVLQVIDFFGDEILRRCMKAGTTVQSVELKWLKNFKIPLPDIKRQNEIADILTSANDRLTAERDRLRKLENIKRGLMDDLLTNRVSTDKLQGGV